LISKNQLILPEKNSAGFNTILLYENLSANYLHLTEQCNLVCLSHAIQTSMVFEDIDVGFGNTSSAAQVFNTGKDTISAGFDNTLRCLGSHTA
jgi:hypothetical protein